MLPLQKVLKTKNNTATYAKKIITQTKKKSVSEEKMENMQIESKLPTVVFRQKTSSTSPVTLSEIGIFF